MVDLHDLMPFLDDFMGDVGDKDPYMANGLQVRGREEIKLLATGVSASQPLFEEDVARNADALLVHHGLTMPPGMLLDTIFRQRLRFLFEEVVPGNSLDHRRLRREAHRVLVTGTCRRALPTGPLRARLPRTARAHTLLAKPGARKKGRPTREQPF